MLVGCIWLKFWVFSAICWVVVVDSCSVVFLWRAVIGDGVVVSVGFGDFD